MRNICVNDVGFNLSAAFSASKILIHQIIIITEEKETSFVSSVFISFRHLQYIHILMSEHRAENDSQIQRLIFNLCLQNLDGLNVQFLKNNKMYTLRTCSLMYLK